MATRPRTSAAADGRLWWLLESKYRFVHKVTSPGCTATRRGGGLNSVHQRGGERLSNKWSSRRRDRVQCASAGASRRPRRSAGRVLAIGARRMAREWRAAWRRVCIPMHDESVLQLHATQGLRHATQGGIRFAARSGTADRSHYRFTLLEPLTHFTPDSLR
jgi:hypothetical protein